VLTALPLLALALCLSPLAHAADKPHLTVRMLAEKETTVTVQDRREIRYVPVETVNSGDIIRYTVTYINEGQTPARDAALIGPVPQKTVYILNSASRKHDVYFSIDGGRSFAPPPVMHQVRKANGHLVQEPAPAELYTHAKWIVKDTVQPGQSGQTTYKVRVK
jgi:uncharacterized repeat protein (TIGR01451 family)